MLAGQTPVGMVGGAVFCVVDDLASQELLAGCLELAGVGQLLECTDDLRIPQLFGQIHLHTRRMSREGGKTVTVLQEYAAQVKAVGKGAAQVLQGVLCGESGVATHVCLY